MNKAFKNTIKNINDISLKHPTYHFPVHYKYTLYCIASRYMCMCSRLCTCNVYSTKKYNFYTKLLVKKLCESINKHIFGICINYKLDQTKRGTLHPLACRLISTSARYLGEAFCK